MSWSRIALAVALLVALLPLGGCGFHPLYASDPVLGYDPDLAAIQVRPVPDRAGQILAASLREQLNPRGVTLPTRYVLSVGMTIVRSDLGIRRDASSARSDLLISANYSLRAAGNEAVIFSDSIRSFTAFNLPDDAYAATVAERDAREEAARSLGQEIALRLAVFMRQKLGS